MGFKMKTKQGILFEPVQDVGFPDGYYYAHIPTLGLTTHGLGNEGARQAALELARSGWMKKTTLP